MSFRPNELNIYSFLCRGCAATMQLPAQKLGYMFGGPGWKENDDSSVGIVCPRCKLVGNYSLLKNSPDYSPPDVGTMGHTLGETEFVGELKCEKENCKTPLPVFAIWNADTTEEEREADRLTWHAENLHCQ